MAKKPQSLFLDKDTVHKKVPLGSMHVLSRHAQRSKLNDSRVNYLLSNFDLDRIGMPVLNERSDGTYYILDGQHRKEALVRWLGEGWEKQKIECEVFIGLTEAEESAMFLALNDTLRVGVLDKFRASVNAGFVDQVHIQKIVEGAGLCISTDKVPGAISAVGTLQKVYHRSDGDTLSRTLRIVRDAFGDSGFRAQVIDGIGHLCQRYNGVLDESVAIDRLHHVNGGVHGLLGKAEGYHLQTGNAKAQCVAAAAVDIINAKRGGKKLPSWWKSTDKSA